MNTKQRVSAQRGRASCRFGRQRVGCDRISLPRNPQGRKIATNNFGIREMSGTFRKEQVTRECGHPSGEEVSMKNRETCRRNMLAAVSAAWLATGLIGHPPGAA